MFKGANSGSATDKGSRRSRNSSSGHSGFAKYRGLLVFHLGRLDFRLHEKSLFVITLEGCARMLTNATSGSMCLVPTLNPVCGSLPEPNDPDGVDTAVKAFPIGLHSSLERSEWLMLFGGGLGILHHLDHVLRFDHSGWPFRDIVTPFSCSLLVYPLLGIAFFWRCASQTCAS